MRKMPWTLVLLLLSLFVLSGCKPQVVQAPPSAPSHPVGLQNPCTGGGGHGPNPMHPQVCIDPTTLKPEREKEHAKRAVWMDFWTNNGAGTLKVTSVVLENTGSTPGGGHAWGKVKANAVVNKEYKYTINLDGRINDPTIIIDP